MERIIKYGGKLFFGSLVICILSFFYFKLIPCTKISNLIGYIFLEAFLGYNFYIGYKYKLSIKESLIVGILGCGFGIFLLFFATFYKTLADFARVLCFFSCFIHFYETDCAPNCIYYNTRMPIFISLPEVSDT